MLPGTFSPTTGTAITCFAVAVMRAVVVVGLSAILGHAFTPILGFRGGKSIAITFGVLLVLPHYEVVIAFTAFMFIAFLLIERDAWLVVFAAAGTLAYLMITKGNSWESLLMLGVLAILAIKHSRNIKS